MCLIAQSMYKIFLAIYSNYVRISWVVNNIVNSLTLRIAVMRNCIWRENWLCWPTAGADGSNFGGGEVAVGAAKQRRRDELVNSGAKLRGGEGGDGHREWLINLKLKRNRGETPGERVYNPLHCWPHFPLRSLRKSQGVFWEVASIEMTAVYGSCIC